MDRNTREEMDALWSQFDHMWKYLGHKDEAIKASREADRLAESVNRFKTEIREQLSEALKRAEQYNTVMAVVGYTGYFATWSFSKDAFSQTDNRLIGILGLTSIIAFVTWEVLNMLFRFSTNKRLINLISRERLPDEFFDELKAVKDYDARLKVRFYYIWAMIFGLAATTAAGGALIMIRALWVSLNLPGAAP